MTPTSELIEKYESMLKKCTGKDTDWFKTPFFVGERAVSTDKFSLISVPKFNDVYKDMTEKTKGIYPLQHNCNKEILLSELKDAISKVPLIDCFDKITTKCDACYGKGEVDYEFSYGVKDYTIEHECPVCEGEGTVDKINELPPGKKQYDYSKGIKIGNSIFHIERIEFLILVAETLSSEIIYIVRQDTKTRPNLFSIKEAEVLLMPMISNEEDVCANIIIG